MPRVHGVVALLDVDGAVEALPERLQSARSGSLNCPRAAPHSRGCFMHIRAVV